MKSITDVEAEIADLKKKYTEDELKELRKQSQRTFNAHFARISWLMTMVMYLESAPHESFIRSDLERLENLLDKIKAGYRDWRDQNPQLANLDESKAKTKYNNEMDTKTVSGQITAYKYLLGL
jgi:hypothetical protein